MKKQPAKKRGNYVDTVVTKKKKCMLTPDAKLKGESRSGYRVVKPEDLDIMVCKSYYGGSFPVISGRKYKYPAPENERAWVCLIAKALTWKNKEMYLTRKPELKEKSQKNKNHNKYAYLLYHSRPEQIQRRAKRNLHRAHYQKNGIVKKYDGKEVHHLDQRSMDLKKTVPLTPCQHRKLHGQKCNK